MQFQIYKSSLALIQLAQKVQFKPQMRPVCLPQHGVSVDEVSGQNCYITGEWIYLMNKIPYRIMNLMNKVPYRN